MRRAGRPSGVVLAAMPQARPQRRADHSADTIGLNVKQVVATGQRRDLSTIERGEVHDAPSIFQPCDRRGRMAQADSGFRVLVQFARATRHPDFPDVPTARELAKNEAARALIELAELPYTLSRPFAAPPDIPADRAMALQRRIPRRPQ